MPAERIWGTSEARANLSELVSGALEGAPQVIRKRTGEEVVVVSRADYERMKPSLKDYLLGSAGTAGSDEDDALHEALRRVRASGAEGLAPR